MTNPNSDALLPCPWCNMAPNSGCAYGIGGAYVNCVNRECGVKPEVFVGAVHNPDVALIEAKKIWQSRATIPAQPVVGKHNMRDAVDTNSGEASRSQESQTEPCEARDAGNQPQPSLAQPAIIPIPASSRSEDIPMHEMIMNPDLCINRFAMLWKNYAMEADDKMTKDAVELKRKLLAAIPASPLVRAKTWNDQINDVWKRIQPLAQKDMSFVSNQLQLCDEVLKIAEKTQSAVQLSEDKCKK